MVASLPAAIEQVLEGLKSAGDGWTARCPAHDDHRPSLTLSVADGGKVLWHCQAGCEQQAVYDALVSRGVPVEQLRGDTSPSAPRGEWTPHGDAIALYDYTDEHGKLLFQVCRTLGKQFPQRRPDPSKPRGWAWTLGDVRRVLYRLPQTIQAVADGKPVWICEGEKDVETLVGIGQHATCNPGGAGKWRADYADVFAGAMVTIVADKDAPGQAHARQVLASLRDIAAVVRVVEAAEPHKDITDHIRAGLTTSDVLVTHRPEEPVVVELAPDLYDILEADIPDYEWLIPGLLERQDRLILTGFEGLGKSYLVRQMAVCAAAGVQPFTLVRHKPLRVLMVDAENNLRQSRRVLRRIEPVLTAMDCAPPRGGVRFLLRPEGLDLASDEDQAWLYERVTAHQPDLLFLGPLYRLHDGDLREEVVVKSLWRVIDHVRARSECAVVIEAHAGHSSGMAIRSVRPYGASAIMRWPEFGYGLAPNQDTDAKALTPLSFTSWRGDRDERDWPDQLRRGWGDELPWCPDDPNDRRAKQSVGVL